MVNNNTKQANIHKAIEKKPTKEQAKEAIRVILDYIGDNSSREGLLETPDRVVKMYDEIFAGYKNSNAQEILAKTFQDVSGYEDIVMVRDIEFTSFCEHHMLPIRGVCHISYKPNGSVVGLSKLARLVDMHSKRLQVQERITNDILADIAKYLKPKWAGVIIKAGHDCMAIRGIKSKGSLTITESYSSSEARDTMLKIMQI